MSLNLRIIISATVVLIIFITLTALTLERAFVESTEAALRDKLESQLYLLMAEAEVNPQGEFTLPSSSLEALLNMPSSGLYAQVIDQNNNTLWISSSTLDAYPPKPQTIRSGEKVFSKLSSKTGNKNNHRSEDYYSFSHGVNWNTESGNLALTFNITSDLQTFNKQIKRYRKTLWGWLMAMASLLLISQAIILRWGLLPLRKVGTELNNIENGQQDQVKGNYPEELKRLTDNINILLNQERQQKARYRNALGDLAHSLKTPLAVIQNSLNETERKSNTLIAEQLSAMNHIVEYQLQRAATSGAMQIGAAIPLKTTVEKITASLQKVYRDKSLNLDNHIDSGLNFKGDEGDLMEILGNLLDNAFKWARNTIAISARQQGKQLCITIHDDGPGIKKDHIEKLLQRGIRADQNIAGHGIGLSIVNNIVEAYQGTLEISQGSMGGARIILTI